MKWFQRIVAVLSGTFLINMVVNDQEELVELSTNETFHNFIESAKGILFTPIVLLFESFIKSPKNFFINLGTKIVDALGLTPENILSANFVFIVIGMLVGIMIIKYIITWVLELISKLADPA